MAIDQDKLNECMGKTIGAPRSAPTQVIAATFSANPMAWGRLENHSQTTAAKTI